MLTAEKQKATYDDYALLPEGAKCQFIDGEIIEMATPIVAHQNQRKVSASQRSFCPA